VQCAELDPGLDLLDLGPGNAHEPTAGEPRRESPQAAAPLPSRRTTQDRRHRRRPIRDPFQLQIVHLAAAAPVDVDQLVVENPEAEVDLAPTVHPCP